MAVVAQVRPLPVQPRSLAVEVPAMAVFSAALLPIMFSGRRISRGEGLLLLAAYAAFLAWIGLTSMR
jgi:cation:H+ antiporter